MFYDTPRVKGKTFPADSPATLLSIGAVLEIIMSVAADWKLAPRLTLKSELPDQAGQYAAIEFLSSGQHSGLVNMVHKVRTRHTNRLAYRKKALPRRVSKNISALQEHSARLLCIEDPAWIRRVADVNKTASKIRFQTQEVHEWLGRSLRFSATSAAVGDGMDIATLGLPPGGGWFLRFISSWQTMQRLNRLGVYSVVSAIDSAPLYSSPTIVAIIAPNTTAGAIHAGRLMARAWTELNKEGISVHPYYVVADQLARHFAGEIPEKLIPLAQDIAIQSSDLFNLSDNETLHMLFRVGYSRKKPRYSQRLPLEAIYEENPL